MRRAVSFLRTNDTTGTPYQSDYLQILGVLSAFGALIIGPSSWPAPAPGQVRPSGVARWRRFFARRGVMPGR
jgi:hypothetical protein